MEGLNLPFLQPSTIAERVSEPLGEPIQTEDLGTVPRRCSGIVTWLPEMKNLVAATHLHDYLIG